MGICGSSIDAEYIGEDDDGGFSADECLRGDIDCCKEKTALRAVVGTFGKEFTIYYAGGVDMIFKSKTTSVFGKSSVLTDKKGNFIAFCKAQGKGIMGAVTEIFRSTPAFEGQESETVKEIDGDLYKFSKITVQQRMNNTADGTYELYTSEKGIMKQKLRGKRLAGFTSNALVYSSIDTKAEEEPMLVGKLKQVDTFGKKYDFWLAKGVDIIAAVGIASCVLPGDGSTAGALAGAGVY